MAKRILYLEDLYDFYSNKYKRSTKFSAEKSGEPLVVQVHGRVNFDESDRNKDGLLPVHLQSCHTDLNVNGSNIESSVMEAALPSFSNRPILGYIHKVTTDENPEGQWEFYSHNMHEDENGDVIYDEYPIGIIPESCNAQLVYDEEKKKTYCEVDGYIFEEYSKAAEILQREGECSVSVELSIRELSYDARQKFLNIEDFWFSGVTILGKTPQGDEVKPGMSGSNIKLTDFSLKNNSLFSDYESKMVELQARLEKLETACFDNKKNNSKEGGNENLSKFEELCQKYEKTVDDITFDYKNMSNDELVEAFAKAFDETDSTDDGSEGDSAPSGNETATDGTVEGENNPTEKNPDESEKGDTTEDETPFIDDDESKKKVNNALTRTFEISHDDIRYALYNLLSSYEDVDNEWYYITGVYDSYFVYESWDGGKIYGQKYTKDNDNVALDGERYSLHKTYLTDSEYAEIESMRSNYAELKAFKENVEKNELHSKKESLLADEKYSVLSDNEAFTELKKNMDNYSLDDLETKAKVIFADYVSSVGNFSLNSSNENKSHSMQLFGDPNTRRNSRSGRYGDIFKK